MIGKILNQYRILEGLGSGAMGLVYRAYDRRLQRSAAIKILPAHVSDDAEARERFLLEARVASALDHPNICTIYEIGETDSGRMYIAMAYYDGETLKERLTREPLEIAQGIDVARQVAAGLACSHRAEMIHRDIKPANLFLTSEGQVKILDFGLVKTANSAELTRTGTSVGTPYYMSPEQTRGEVVDRRTDLWSLGVSIYEALTGQKPFAGNTIPAIIYSILGDRPAPLDRIRPEVPESLAAIVGRLLAKNADERYGSAEELQVALAELGSTAESGGALASIASAAASSSGVGELTASFVGPIQATARSGSGSVSRAPLDRKIAVLPLTNLSSDGTQDYLADGMTEALINDLARIGALRVISRTSVMRFKQSSLGLPEIAEELGVGFIIEGSVFSIGDRVRIAVQLIDAQRDEHLWADSYERSLGDVFSILNDVAKSVANEIRVNLTPQEEESFEETRLLDTEAHRLYLQGRYCWNKRSPESLNQSLDFFQQAIDRDPFHALAHCGVADSLSVLGSPGFDHRPPQESFVPAREAALRALEIDPYLGEAHTALAWIYENQWQWAKAEEHFQLAFQHHASYATAYQWYAEHHWAAGRHQAADRALRKAAELDPLSLIIRLNQACHLHYNHRHSEAVEELRKILAVEPQFWIAHEVLAVALVHEGYFPEATAAAEQGLSLQTGSSVAIQGWVAGRTGNREQAARLQETLEERALTIYVPPAFLSLIPTALGDFEEAFGWLEKGLENGDSVLRWVVFDPLWDALRPDPRLGRIFRAMGL